MTEQLPSGLHLNAVRGGSARAHAPGPEYKAEMSFLFSRLALVTATDQDLRPGAGASRNRPEGGRHKVSLRVGIL